MPALGPMNCSESFAKKHCTTGLSPSGIASYFMSATSKPLTGTCFRGAPSVCGPFIPPSINFFPSVSTPSAAEKRDRKSTRLNSSHSQISYAVFCLKKKNKTSQRTTHHCKTFSPLNTHTSSYICSKITNLIVTQSTFHTVLLIHSTSTPPALNILKQ